MNVTLTVRHTDINKETKDYIEGKVAKLQKYFNNLQSIQVIIDEVKIHQTVEILIKSPIFDFTVTEADEDVRAAFDKAYRVAEKKIRREKERVHDAKKSKL